MLGYELILKRGNDLKTETCHWFTLVIVLYENGVSTLKRQLYKLVKQTLALKELTCFWPQVSAEINQILKKSHKIS